LIKIITTNLTRESNTLKINFNLIDDVAPTVILDSTEVSITVNTSLTNAQLRTFIATTSLSKVQEWYNVWKVRSANDTVQNSNKSALETFINSNIIL